MSTVTGLLELVQSDVEKKFSTLSHRGHIEKRIQRLAAFESKGHTSACMTLSGQIKEMFEKYGVKCKKDLTAKGYKELLDKSDIPDFFELEPRFWETVYGMFEMFPSPTQYIEKIVDTLGDPEFKGDSLRLRILKQFIKYTDFLKYTSFFSENFKDDINACIDGDLSKLTDRIVDSLIADKGKVPAFENLELLIQKVGAYLTLYPEEIQRVSDILFGLTGDAALKNSPSYSYICESVLKILFGKTADTPEIIAINDIFAKALDRVEEESKTVKEINTAFSRKYNDYFSKVNERGRRTRLKYIVDNVFLGIYFDEKVCLDYANKIKASQFDGLVKLPMYIDGKPVSDADIDKSFEIIKSAVNGIDLDDHSKLNDSFTAFFKNVSEWIQGVKPKDVTGKVALSILEFVFEDNYNALTRKLSFYKNNFKKDRKAYVNSVEYRLESDEKYLGLIKLCEDLAEGVFRTNGAPKKALYPFAVAFGMRYYNDTKVKSYNVNLDIDKNLFKDYYCDNIVRFVGAQSLRIQEAEPSGIGINYKNFAEVIYLYYLSRSDEYSPALIIKKANKLINKIKSKGKDQKYVKSDSDTLTHHYRKSVVSTLLSLEEGQIEEYILKKFNCNIYSEEDGKYVGVFQLEDDENSAWKSFSEIIEIISDDYDCFNPHIKNFYQETEDTFGTATEILRKLEIMFSDTEKYPSGESFLQLIRFILDKLNLNDLRLDKVSPQEVSRTKIIAAYYYLYFFLATSGDDTETWDNYKDFFEGFSSGVDPYLEDSYYQPISFKNIFDSIVIFLCYRIVNAEHLIEAQY